MNIEENNLPLFKYTPEITSQLLIQTNESQEFVQVPNICDDLLLTELDGTVTWTLGGLPILLNGQNDSQSLLVNQTNEESLEDLQPPQDTFQDILEQDTSEDQFAENNAETSDNTEIVYPLEISDKSFLTDNGLFITNEVINDQVDISPNCELVSNDNELNREITNEEVSQESSDSEIQSSDVSSQEAFIDINGMLISQQSVLNLNCPDLLFNIQEPQTSSPNGVLNSVLNQKQKILKRKLRLDSTVSFLKTTKNDSVSDIIQNYKNEETVENIQNEVQNNQNSFFNCDESVNSLIKVLNVDGSTTVLNIDGTLFNDKSISKDTSNIIAYDDELQSSQIPVDDEPDSTVANDTEDSLNIDDLATIITAYQCKKCDFTCNDRDQFLTHFRDAHIQTQSVVVNQIFEVKPELLVPNTMEEVQNVFETKELNLNRKTKRLKLPDNKNVQTISILCTNGEIPVLNNGILAKSEPNLEETNLVNSEEFRINLSESGIPQNEIYNHEEYDQQQLNDVESKFSNLQPTKFIYGTEEFSGVFVNGEETEKKIMRIKKRKKPQKKIRVLNIPQETNSYVSNFLLEINPIENDESNIITSQINEELTTSENPVVESESEKQLIYLCSQCADQFLTVEDCRAHMIKVHKLCAAETPEKTNSVVEENLEIKTENPIQVSDDKNKKIIEKFLGQDALKSRKHKCSIKGCPYRFAKVELLARHETCHVEGNRSQFRCPECEEVQPSWRICSIHLWRCHQLDLDLYACPLCSYRGSTSVKLKHHIKIHSEEREYVCPECGRGFKQPSQLRNHRVIHLEHQPRWYTQKHCDKCGKMFADSKCLKKHIQAVHSKLKPFICNVCGHSCARKAMLQMHLRQHTGEKPYSCSLCFYKTGDHNSLRRHKMRHSGTRPYKCPHCDYTAIQSNSYKNHLASKHPGMSGAYNCSECTFKTVNEDVYMSHMNDHKNNLIDNKRKPDRSGKVSPVHLLNVLNNSSSELSSSNENELFSGAGGSGQNNITSKKNLDIEDDETQNCFLSLGDLTDEQTVDTGGITIPADPDEPDPIHM